MKKSLLSYIFLMGLISLFITSCEKDLAGTIEENDEIMSIQADPLTSGASLFDAFPELMEIRDQFQPIITGSTEQSFYDIIGIPLWEKSLINTSPYLIIEPNEVINSPTFNGPTQPTVQVVVPFASATTGDITSILITEFDYERDETRQKFIHRHNLDLLYQVAGEQKFEAVAQFAFSYFDNDGNPPGTTASFGNCCLPCYVSTETGRCVLVERWVNGILVYYEPCPILDCGPVDDDGGNPPPPPPPSGGGTGSPTVVIGGVDVPVWYIDNYISNSNWTNQRPGQATGGGGGPGADVHAFFDQFSNYNPPGGGTPQNTDPPITDCLTDAFPSEDQPSSEQGGGSSLTPGLTILQLLTDLHGQSEETFDLIMNIHNQVDLNQDQGRYLIYNTNEANIINEALENGTTTAATVSGYLNFRLTIDPCQSIVPGLNFELLLSKPEIFNLLAGHLLEDPTDSEHIQVVNLIASNPDILNVHLDDDDGPNYCELELILSGFSYARCAWSINENADIAASMTVERFGYNGRNDCSDAFRHAFFNALNAMSCDIDMAREFGEAHECDVPNELIMEKEMDLWNNEIGYSIISDFGALSNHNALADIVLLRLSESEGKYLTPLDADSKIIPGVTGIALTHDDCLP